MGLNQDEIGQRIWALGINVGFDNDNYRKVLERIRLSNPIWSATSDFAQVGG
jgi:hypothetical protein